MFKPLYFLFVILRVILAPLIFLFPVPVVAILFLLDYFDGELASKKVLTLEQYEKIDKALDLWQYVYELLFCGFMLKIYFPLLMIFFVYRMVGEILFFLTNKRKLLVVFPNFFENAFLLVFFGTYIRRLSFLTGRNFALYLVIVCALKLIQEWWLHWKNLSTMEIFFHKKKQWKK